MSILDLPAERGQRSASFTFTLLETVSGHRIGDVHPDRSSIPTLEHDATRAVKRRLANVYFPVDESEAINPLLHSLKVAMVLDRSYPLGVYQFADDPYVRTSVGRRLRATLLDRSVELQEKLAETFSLSGGTNLREGITLFLDTIGFGNYQVDGTTARTSVAISWPPGTVKSKVLADLAANGGYFSPWITSNDVLRVLRVFDPAASKPTFDYDKIPPIADSITESNDLLTIPNRFRVVDVSSVGDDIVGTYEIPAQAPHSKQKRGRFVTETQARQGLTANDASADEAARALGLQSPGFETVEMSVPPDPRHESYDVARWRGFNHLELRWSMPLVEGGAMQLKLQRSYAV